MKKSNTGLSSIFSISEEMIRGNGEDCFYHEAKGNKFIIAALDGCGGSGAKKYENFSGKTGAYIASRAVCGGIKAWFSESSKGEDLMKYVQKALTVCKNYADQSGKIMGSLSKAFPTTAAIIVGEAGKDKLSATCYWAGDSRCYLLDANGLHQLTADDLEGQDAMSNLTNDGVMTNVINASTQFTIHAKKIVLDKPCVLLTATDGCFGYLNSPMEFEYLLTVAMQNASSIYGWKKYINEHINGIAGDDYTLCAAVWGYDSFDDIKNSMVNRHTFVSNNYINTDKDINSLWNVYKKEYSAYL